MPLSSIIGHQQIVRLLETAVGRERVPQSLLFAGPDGVGKRTVALALAQAVNCTKQPRFDACGVCPTCVRIARGQHTDVTVIDRRDEASIKIKHIRERLLEVAGYRPFEARRRVFIIDQADEMTTEAQDALLKTLEEPPSTTMIILVSAYPDTLLSTIQSRCRRLRFGPLTEADVERVLTERCGIETDRARLMAAASGGSVRRALDEETGHVADDRDAALVLLRAAARGPVGPRLKAAAALAKHESKRRDREALGDRLAQLSALCRDLTALQAHAADVVASRDLAGALEELGRAYDVERLSRAFITLDKAQQALDRNASPKIVADWVGVKL